MLNSIFLHSTKNGSDKVYNLQVVEVAGGYNVQYQNGPRGGTLQTGFKCPAPVDLEGANKKFEQVVKAKKSDGYLQVNHGGSAPVVIAPALQEESIDLLLLGDTTTSLNDIIEDDSYLMQEKKDGERRPIYIDNGHLKAFNKKGMTVPGCGFLNSLLEIGMDVEFDAEIIGDTLHIFDLLKVEDTDLRNTPVLDRYNKLETLFKSLQLDKANFRLVRTAIGKGAKRALLQLLINEGAEGVVFKQLNARYTTGRSKKDYLKVKFVSEASFIVTKVNNKRSVGVSLLDENGKEVPAGNVTIPVNREIPQEGQVIEIQYLYAFPASGIIFQPVFKSIRTDVERNECVTSQLKFKAE